MLVVRTSYFLGNVLNDKKWKQPEPLEQVECRQPEISESLHTRSLEPKQQREWQLPSHGRDCHEQVTASHWLLLPQLFLRPLLQWRSFDSTTENQGHTLNCSSSRIGKHRVRVKEKCYSERKEKECFTNCDFSLHDFVIKVSFDNYI